MANHVDKFNNSDWLSYLILNSTTMDFSKKIKTKMYFNLI